MRKNRFSHLACLLGAALAPAAQAQFTTLVTDFEGAFSPPGQFEAQVIFREPGLSGTTSPFLDLPEGQDSYVSPEGGPFGVVHSGAQSQSLFWAWKTPGAHASWCRVVTQNTQYFPNPAVHMNGKVRMWLAGTAWTSGFGAQVNGAKVRVGLGIRETGEGAPMGANGGVSGSIEWVGLNDKLVEILAGPDGICNSAANGASDDVQVNPVSSTVGPDGVCVDAGTNGVLNSTRVGDDVIASTPIGLYQLPLDGVMREYVFDFPALAGSGNVFAFTGNGTLSAAPNNRGTLEHLVVTNDPVNGTVGAKIALLFVDDVTFEAPVLDPPGIVTAPEPPRPLDEAVNLRYVKPTASLVEIYQQNNFGPDSLLGSVNPAGATELAVSTTPLPAGVSIYARQTVGSNVSDDSTPVPITPSGNSALRIAAGVRETHQYDNALNCGDDGTGFDPNQPSLIEFIGAPSSAAFGVPNAARVPTNPDWIEVELDPCVDGVTAFSGNGEIFVNTNALGEPLTTKSVFEGLYFRIDSQNPTAGPYTIYIDDLVIKNANGPGLDCIVDDFEGYTPGDHIAAGANGVCDTTANTTSPADDVQVVPVGGGTFTGQIVVSPGPNGILETTATTDDFFSSLKARFNNPGNAGASVGVAATPDQTNVTADEAFSGTQSLRVRWGFIDATNPNNTMRLTTNGSIATNPPETLVGPDPVIPVTYVGCEDGVDMKVSFRLLLAPAVVPGDCDLDGDVDLGDVGCFQRCFGPGPLGAECEDYDFEVNGAVDLADYNTFRFLIIGPQE